MLKTHLVLMDELKSYASPAKKIERMVKSGELTRVVRGTDPGSRPSIYIGKL